MDGFRQESDVEVQRTRIEAQIVEINSQRSRELGFEWGGPNGELASFTGGVRDMTRFGFTDALFPGEELPPED